ncbi:MAG TPA: tRNA-dihydrouridine synthase [Paludibacter sp.]
MINFWKQINKPIIALAPMEDVTDTVFREVIRSVSSSEALNVLFTEFTSTDGLCNEIGRKNVSSRLVVSDSEREWLNNTQTKLVAQIWGSDPDKFRQSAQLISETRQFDGIDINMGCPVKKVVKSKSCSALINYPELAREIIVATKDGTHLPVSVKTRIGFNTIITEKWIGNLLDENPAAITIHGRTQKMLSTGNAMWDEIGKAVQLRNERNSDTLILGNGDVDSYSKAMEHIVAFGVDGVMVGTGVFKNPWMFNQTQTEISMEMRIDLLIKHITLYDKTWGKTQNFNVLKRFFKIYLNGFDGAAHWRDKLMHTHSCDEALKVIKLLQNG